MDVLSNGDSPLTSSTGHTTPTQKFSRRVLLLFGKNTRKNENRTTYSYDSKTDSYLRLMRKDQVPIGQMSPVKIMNMMKPGIKN
ncbi:hypothetical protein MASR2M39_24760 [Ignavibacteriales bacterium]